MPPFGPSLDVIVLGRSFDCDTLWVTTFGLALDVDTLCVVTFFLLAPPNAFWRNVMLI